MRGVISGRIEAPYRLLLYGTSGVGKTSFAAKSEKPIFLSTESGTEQMDVDRFEESSTYIGAIASLQLLLSEQHGYRTLCIDTVDWMGKLVDEHVCKKNGWASIESPGYGKGQTAAHEEWRRTIGLLGQIRDKGMHIIMLGHCEIKKHKDPSGDEYDRYGLKIAPKTAAMLQEWSDAVLFAQFETATRHTKEGRSIGVQTGERVLRTERAAAWDAKNRMGLPATIPLDFRAFAGPSEDEYASALASMSEERRAKALEWVESTPNKVAARRIVVAKSKEAE